MKPVADRNKKITKKITLGLGRKSNLSWQISIILHTHTHTYIHITIWSYKGLNNCLIMGHQLVTYAQSCSFEQWYLKSVIHSNTLSSSSYTIYKIMIKQEIKAEVVLEQLVPTRIPLLIRLSYKKFMF